MQIRRRSTTVLLVEDDDAYARALECIFLASDTVEVVGRARDGAEGVGLAFALEPDCILMDLSMPIIDGLEATRAIRSRLPLMRVVILTSSDDPGDRASARAAGAAGYLTKGCSPGELESAVTGSRVPRSQRPRSQAVLATGLAP